MATAAFSPSSPTCARYTTGPELRPALPRSSPARPPASRPVSRDARLCEWRPLDLRPHTRSLAGPSVTPVVGHVLLGEVGRPAGWIQGNIARRAGAVPSRPGRAHGPSSRHTRFLPARWLARGAGSPLRGDRRIRPAAALRAKHTGEVGGCRGAIEATDGAYLPKGNDRCRLCCQVLPFAERKASAIGGPLLVTTGRVAANPIRRPHGSYEGDDSR